MATAAILVWMFLRYLRLLDAGDDVGDTPGLVHRARAGQHADVARQAIAGQRAGLAVDAIAAA